MRAAQLGAVESLKFLMRETPLGRPGADGLDAVDDNGVTACYYAC